MAPIDRRDHHPRTPFALHVIGGPTAKVVALGEMRQQQVELLSRCIAALAARGTARVVVDLTDVSFLSPRGRRALPAIPVDVPGVEVFLTGLRGPARRALAERHARTRIRAPRVRCCRRCMPALRIALPRRW